MNNFDLRKFLSENKLTPTSKVLEESIFDMFKYTPEDLDLSYQSEPVSEKDFLDREILFDFEGETYQWTGDYRVNFYGDSSTRNIEFVITNTREVYKLEDPDTNLNRTSFFYNSLLPVLKPEIHDDYMYKAD